MARHRWVDRCPVNSRQTQQVVAVEWPTLGVIMVFWVLLGVLITTGTRLPPALLIVAFAVLGGLYMSIQHEAIHGHPTPSRSLNWLLSSAPLGVVLPIARYRDTHLAHHAADLTDPADDPESHYVSPEAWAEASGSYRMLLRANRTMVGRLAIGPFLGVARSLRADVSLLRSRRDVRAAWMLHVIAVGALVTVLRIAGVPMWIYMLGFVFGGSSLTALRSFVEHRAIDDGARSAIVRSGWFFSAIFLNNNLHYTHHQLPGAAWFRLPELTRDLNAETVAANGAGVYRGYSDVARQFMFKPFDQPVHPLSVTIDG